MFVFIPKLDINCTGIIGYENLNIISMTYCVVGKSFIEHLPDKNTLRFNENVIYLLNLEDERTKKYLEPYNNEKFKTNLNSIREAGLYLIKLNKNIKLDNKKNIFTQFKVKDIKSISTGEKWCVDALPWNNTLKSIVANDIYIVSVKEFIGITQNAGVNENGVHLLDENQIEGIVLKPNDFLQGIRFETNELEAEFKIYPLSVEYNPLFNIKNTIELQTTSITSENDMELKNAKFDIIFDKNYLGKEYILKYNGKTYRGNLDNFGACPVEVTEISSEGKITFKPIKNNEAYDYLSMYVFTKDKLHHIRFDKNYIGEKFFIHYDEKKYLGVFKNKVSLDEPVILKRMDD